MIPVWDTYNLNLFIRNALGNDAVFRSELVVNKVVACLGNNTTNFDETIDKDTIDYMFNFSKWLKDLSPVMF